MDYAILLLLKKLTTQQQLSYRQVRPVKLLIAVYFVGLSIHPIALSQWTEVNNPFVTRFQNRRSF